MSVDPLWVWTPYRSLQVLLLQSLFTEGQLCVGMRRCCAVPAHLVMVTVQESQEEEADEYLSEALEDVHVGEVVASHGRQLSKKQQTLVRINLPQLHPPHAAARIISLLHVNLTCSIYCCAVTSRNHVSGPDNRLLLIQEQPKRLRTG